MFVHLGQSRWSEPAHDYEPKTINEHIECLARMTGAPAYLRGAGAIALRRPRGSRSTPRPNRSSTRLDEAFRREENDPPDDRARQAEPLASFSDNFKRFGKAYVVAAFQQLKKCRASFASKTQPHATPVAPAAQEATRCT